MSDHHIRDICAITTSKGKNSFVGIRVDNKAKEICFPLGFAASQDDEILRKEVFALLDAIATTTGKKKSQVDEKAEKFDETGLPVQAYLAVIFDFFSRGYYKEKEICYKKNASGKIHWGRTIKTQKPFVQNGDFYYLDYISRVSRIKDNEFITQIHKYCVYESFCKLGWLFTSYIPPKPNIKNNKKLFDNIIKEKLHHTFNDNNRALFRNMLAIINAEADQDAEKKLYYGTYNFEYVWEQLIDRVYGIENKTDYYPKTTWIIDGTKHNNSVLKPDTIMIWGDNVYILDAKYYQYGVTGDIGDLPGSSSIDKQITYGEYVAETEKFRKKHGNNMKVYNAFLMPYEGGSTKRIGEGISNWKGNEKTYERVQGILIDTKNLILNTYGTDSSKIKELADLISRFVD